MTRSDYSEPQARALIGLALVEDLSTGDPTSERTIPEGCNGRALMIAREDLIFCGGGLISTIFEEAKLSLNLSNLVSDSVSLSAGDRVCEISGSVSEMLSIERIVLNFLQRLSGVATYTSSFIKSSGELTVLDTRKTTPGWRSLEKYATRVGGASNHRMSLGDMILIKDNHVDANGGSVTKTLERLYSGGKPEIPVEIEVRNIKELKEAIEFNPDWIMLDNMDNNLVSESLAIVKDSGKLIKIEVSGGVTSDRLSSLDEVGAAYASAGALTSKATNVDIALDIVLDS